MPGRCSRIVFLSIAPLLLVPSIAGHAERPNVVEVERYRLQSNPWVNLHQRLISEARFGTPAPEGLAGKDHDTWLAAVETYRSFLGKRNPIFDRELIAINDALSAAWSPDLPEGVPAVPAGALSAAMPLYERLQWPQDRRVNEFWIALAEPMLASAATELTQALATAYGRPFPAHVLVDVTQFAWQFGAYTVGDGASVHAVIASSDPANQGFAALESLMHEPSHGIVGATDGAIGEDITRIAKELDLRPRHNLWHALLFYTCGELTRRSLEARGIQDFQRMIDRGMYERGFGGMREALETHWQAYLDGKIRRDEAIRKILLATASPAKPARPH